MSYARIAKRTGLTVEQVQSVFQAILIESRKQPWLRFRYFGTFKIRRTPPHSVRSPGNAPNVWNKGRTTLLFKCSPEIVAILSGGKPADKKDKDDPLKLTAEEFGNREHRDKLRGRRLSGKRRRQNDD